MLLDAGAQCTAICADTQNICGIYINSSSDEESTPESGYVYMGSYNAIKEIL